MRPLILFIFSILFTHSLTWAGVTCPEDSEVKDLKKVACVAECEAFYKENPKLRPKNSKDICESMGKTLLSFSNKYRNANRFLYCAKGVWKGILNVPEQFRLFLQMVHDVGVDSKEYQDFLKACDKDLSCRIEAARTQVHFRERNPDGSYKLSDQEVQKQIQGEDIFVLTEKTRQHKDSLARVCQIQLLSINRSIETDSKFTEWNLAALQERYQKLYKWDPYCPAVLKYDFPTEFGDIHPGAGWLAELGVKYQCLPSEKIQEAICLEIAKFVLDPTTLIAGGGGLGAKALNKLGVGLRIEKAALQVIERRTAKVIARKTKYDPRLPPRDAYIARNIENEVSDFEQNQLWIDRADQASISDKTRFLEVENTKMKFLNDNLRDKNLVTSMTNRYKELIDQKIASIERTNPGFKIKRYSDFKSVRFAFDGNIPRNIEDQIELAFQETNKQFADELEKFNIVRKADKPQSWFRAGYGRTADEASALARAGREPSGEGKLIRASDSNFQNKLTTSLKDSETFRKVLEDSLGRTKLMSGRTGEMVPSREAFELIRKSKSDKELAAAIQKRYQIQLSESDAALLNKYSESIDAFSPSLRIAYRQVNNLDDAVEGGFSADFEGLGAGNSQATAEALAGKSDVQSALKAARNGEKKMTTELKDRMKAFRKAVSEVAKCSGDDCIGIAKKSLTSNEKVAILNRLAASPKTRGIRIAFVNNGVKLPSDRTLLSTHGELVEKSLRQELADVLPYERTKQMTFGIDMKTTALNNGQVDVLIGAQPGAAVTAKEGQQIREALSRAVQKVNRQLSKEGVTSSYQAIP